MNNKTSAPETVLNPEIAPRYKVWRWGSGPAVLLVHVWEEVQFSFQALLDISPHSPD